MIKRFLKWLGIEWRTVPGNARAIYGWTVRDWYEYARALERNCVTLSREFDEHPEGYDGPCECQECLTCPN